MYSTAHGLLIDTQLGDIIRLVTKGRMLVYPKEEGTNTYIDAHQSKSPSATPTCANHGESILARPVMRSAGVEDLLEKSATRDDSARQSETIQCTQLATPTCDLDNSVNNLVLVDWASPMDNADPKNWSLYKKLRVYIIINYANAAVYMSSSIYAASQEGVMYDFHVSQTVASLGLALFVLGYGLGPLIFSPLADNARIGRNPPYVVSSVIFLTLSILTATAQDITSLLTLRLLQGFFGSPVLSFGGASLSDICHPDVQPIALYTWACSGFAAPSIAPIISGFAIPVLGWRWSLWEIVIVNGPAVILMLLLPETSPRRILHLRARRLAAADRDRNYRSIMDSKEHQSAGQVLRQSLLVPWQMHALDPSILFTSLYGGLVYGIYYSFFEVFPLVYQGIYGFSLGQSGLPYLVIVVSVVLVGIPYCLYIYLYVNPRVASSAMTPERRLIPGLMASFLVPTGLFLFAWTARADIHWMVPTIGVGLTSAGMVIVLQCVFVYISLGYPHYAASAFGGNNFSRSLIAFGALLWSRPLYENLGISHGSSLIAGVCVLGILGIFALFHYGARLRARSRFTI